MIKFKDCLWVAVAVYLILPKLLPAQVETSGITSLLPRPGDSDSFALSVNNLGQCAGFSLGNANYAVMWAANGSVTDLGFGPGYYAQSINDSGQILVISNVGGGGKTPLVWTARSSTILTNFFVFGGGEGYGPNPQINNLGQVAGYIVQSNTNQVAIYNTSNGSIINLGAPSGSQNVYGTAVNIHGHVIANENGNAGAMAFFYNGTFWTNIAPPLGYTTISLTGINDSDEVVGMAFENNWHAFSWTSSSGVNFISSGVDLQSFAVGINNNQIIVGEEEATNGFFPFVNFCGTNLDLDTIVLGSVTNRPPQYSRFVDLIVAHGVNDKNQIAGRGNSSSASDSEGFLLPAVGQSQYLPYFPGCGDCPHEWLCFLFFALVSSAWLDPATANGFHYEMQSDELFTEIANFPTGFSNSFTVSVNGMVLGKFRPGQSVVFSNYVTQLGSSLINNSGVTQFDITGISPLVDPQNHQGFPLEVGFDRTNVMIAMTMAAIDTNPPQLTIYPAGTNVVLSWPASVAGWTLQTNNNFASSWSNYDGLIINNTVTNTLSAGNMFFRLMHP